MISQRPFSAVPTRTEIESIVHRCADRLIDEQPELLSLDVSERALSHQYALYLVAFFPRPLFVDCEYNRQHRDPKRLSLPSRAASDRGLNATTVFPDIIVHMRDSDHFNLLVLELKKPGEPLEYDELKLIAFRDELGYPYCGHLILGRDRANKIVKTLQWAATTPLSTSASIIRGDASGNNLPGCKVPRM